MNTRPQIAGLVAGIFMLIWAAIFLTWMPVDALRLVTGIVLVPLGLWFAARYIVLRRRSDRPSPAARAKP
ncbi:hypothetical protein SAMN04489743_3798 [Pseudarthrobacter equi]|uniref:Uncharacterized protein n=1 Tax=Pseudarthrobacter equi TaxID=728066 RepID=A0A1H2BLS2_9MICC|nr:hypothetical protein SAMN04489743_3798 [Pseudarthrobacter equi]